MKYISITKGFENIVIIFMSATMNFKILDKYYSFNGKLNIKKIDIINDQISDSFIKNGIQRKIGNIRIKIKEKIILLFIKNNK